MRALFGLFLLAAASFAADADFNGRWDLTTVQTRPRGWWVELNGVGTPNANGSFVSIFGGDRNKIDTIAVANGELKWVINAPAVPEGKKQQQNVVFKAKVAGGKMEGTMEREGQSGAPLKFTGVRAPALDNEKDDGSWKPGKAVELFNGKDASGWHALVPDADMKWTVEKGVLRNAPPTTDIVSDQKFWNFAAHVEFRIVERSNSGIGLRGRYEIQILEDYGKPAGTHGAAALYSRVAPSVNASKPAGEWQSYDIRLVGRDLTVVHNGKKVLDHVHVDGPTAIAEDSNEGEPGPFILQGDHSYVEIRKFTVTPLTK
jgi:hypothetical protein